MEWTVPYWNLIYIKSKGWRSNAFHKFFYIFFYIQMLLTHSWNIKSLKTFTRLLSILSQYEHTKKISKVNTKVLCSIKHEWWFIYVLLSLSISFSLDINFMENGARNIDIEYQRYALLPIILKECPTHSDGGDEESNKCIAIWLKLFVLHLLEFYIHINMRRLEFLMLKRDTL